MSCSLGIHPLEVQSDTMAGTCAGPKVLKLGETVSLMAMSSANDHTAFVAAMYKHQSHSKHNALILITNCMLQVKKQRAWGNQVMCVRLQSGQGHQDLNSGPSDSKYML